MLSVIYNVCDKVAINTQKVGLYVLVQMSHQGAVLMCVCVCNYMKYSVTMELLSVHQLTGVTFGIIISFLSHFSC